MQDQINTRIDHENTREEKKLTELSTDRNITNETNRKILYKSHGIYDSNSRTPDCTCKGSLKIVCRNT